jgi:pimeloyl-ACP methyl ester carboxylesterase
VQPGGAGKSIGTIAAAILVFCALALLPSAAGAAEPVWLCKPGIVNNPCEPSLKTTVISPSGQVLGVRNVQPARHPLFDCFYVYPTVSDQPTGNANLNIDPELRSIALYQAARYSQACRVFAPVYRQVTVRSLLGQATTPPDRELAYNDVLNAWRAYLLRYNRGRGVVLIGHSQGTFVLRRLIAEQIDPNSALRKKLVSALLLGGNATVKQGRDVGGDFQNIHTCHFKWQIRCVIGFSTFNATPPANSLFGRAAAGLQVVCTNPARLPGGSAPLRSVFPTAPFAPGTLIGIATTIVGFSVPPGVSTPWVETTAYNGQCSSANGANVLQITGLPGAPHLNPSPDATWGLHLVDANIALGNLVDTVRLQGFIHFVFSRLHR